MTGILEKSDPKFRHVLALWGTIWNDANSSMHWINAHSQLQFTIYRWMKWAVSVPLLFVVSVQLNAQSGRGCLYLQGIRRHRDLLAAGLKMLKGAWGWMAMQYVARIKDRKNDPWIPLGSQCLQVHAMFKRATCQNCIELHVIAWCNVYLSIFIICSHTGSLTDRPLRPRVACFVC